MRFHSDTDPRFSGLWRGGLLVFAPWLFGFAGDVESWVPVILGLGAIGYSLFTDYELGVVRTIPRTGH